MILWVLFALMTGLVALTVLWPLTRSFAIAGEGNGERALYDAQLADIARDEARGVLGQSEAKAARNEAARRFLRSAPGRSEEPTSCEGSLRRRRAASAFVLSMIPLVSLGLYGGLGSPDLPGQPLQARLTQDPAKMTPFEAIARIEAHLASRPDDGRGWDLIAPLYLKLGRPDDAVKAYAAAIRILGETPQRLADYGEAQVMAAGGIVSAAARQTVVRSYERDPANVKAAFYMGLAAEQDGNLAMARSTYRTLADMGSGTPFFALVKSRLDAIDAAKPQP